MHKLRPGVSQTLSLTVTPEYTAHAMGNVGVHVLGTPAVVLKMEDVSSRILASYLEPGETSVGTIVNIQHIGPAKTGDLVVFRSFVTSVERNRVQFHCTAEAENGQVLAHGTHERAVILTERVDP